METIWNRLETWLAINVSSFKDWLEQFATDLESGKYIFSKEDGGLVAVDE